MGAGLFCCSPGVCYTSSELPGPNTFKQAIGAGGEGMPARDMKNGTWHLVELHPGHTPIGLHWIFHINKPCPVAGSLTVSDQAN
jgi:hypothetical protein